MEEIHSDDVAKAIMIEANNLGLRLNMTQLQKLMFIIYGTGLFLLNRRPFDEHARAWPLGPVFPKTRRLLLEDVKNWVVPAQYPTTIQEDLRPIISSAVKFFGTWSSPKLIEWTHTPGSPWEITTKMPDFKWGQEIGDGLIRDYFSKIVVRRTENAQ